jgi:hypothetical protein
VRRSKYVIESTPSQEKNLIKIIDHWHPISLYGQFRIDENNKDSYVTSVADNTNREFQIVATFFDISTNSKTIKLSYKQEYGFFWEYHDQQYSIFPITQDNLIVALGIRVTRDTFVDAIHDAVEVFNSLLISLSATAGSTIVIDTLELFDEKHDIRLHFSYTNVSSEKSVIEIEEFLSWTQFFSDDKLWNLMTLYHEGHSSRSYHYKLLCFYKIIEAYYDKKVLSHIHKRAKDVNYQVQTFKIEENVLELTLAQFQHRDLVGQSVRKLLDLTKGIRNSIAHVLTNDGEMIDFCKFEVISEYQALINLMDYYTKHILEYYIKLLWKLESSSNTKINNGDESE